MIRKIQTVLFGFLLYIAAPGAHAASPSAIGDWNGVLQTPVGALRVWLTVSKTENNSLSAEFESVDQAPGQKIGVSSVAASGDTLTFTIRRLGAHYEGKWNAELKEWEGTFSQGMNIPLNLKRGKPVSEHTTIEGVDGIWRSKMTYQNMNFRLVLKIKSSENGTLATLDSPDQTAYDIPITGLTREGDQLSFNIPVAGAKFLGSINQNGDSLTGVWYHADSSKSDLVFNLDTSSTGISRKRPQTPTEPFPYDTKEVTVENKDSELSLAGTLTIPEGKGPFPAAVLISGSGPQDRDETVFEHKPFAVLADHLTRNGIAVLRFDDRGVGKSTGIFGQANTQDFATDANAAWHFLVDHKSIDPNRIGMIGHSEGGMVAPIAYSQNSRIAFMVLLAAPSADMVEFMLEQRRLIALSMGSDEESISEVLHALKPVLQIIATTSDETELRSKLSDTLTNDIMMAIGIQPDTKNAAIQQLSSPWSRFFYAYEPRKYLPNIDIPTLALNGELDVQVSAKQNLPELKQHLKNNTDATVLELPKLNHLFQTAETGALGEYADIEETFAPEALKLISDWITSRFSS